MELVEIKDNKNNVVVKHQELVRNARYKLSELGIKVVSILVSMIKVSDEDFKEYHIKINDFKELIGSTSKKTYEYVDIMTDELMRKPLKVGDEKFNWVYYARYSLGDNIVALKIAPELKPYLLELKKNFLQYNITNILSLKSGYVIRLYELCKDQYIEATRYKKEKQRVHFELKIERMRELFEIPDSYSYKDIRVHILDKAVKQFRQKTDIKIEYKVQKIGRKVDRVIITVKANNQGSGDFLSNRKSFIEYVRKMYKPDVDRGIYPIIFEAQGNNGYTIIKVDNNGKLYASVNKKPADLSAEKANEWWDFLYDLALKGALPLQGQLFDENENINIETPIVDTKKTTIDNVDEEELFEIATTEYMILNDDQVILDEISKFKFFNKEKNEEKKKDYISLWKYWLIKRKELEEER
jgi:plasmid replication initiation protein